MSSRLNNLLAQAAVIRDATEEHENTAVRVGTMFVDFIQACLAVLPSEIIDAAGITASTSETNFVVRYRVTDEEGNTSNRSITIPAASSENAGLLTPEQLTQVNSVASSISSVLTQLAAKANTSDVNAALALKANAADVTAALAEKADTDDVEAALLLKADKSELATLDDTLEFAGVMASATITQGTSEKKSTDSDAQVFYVSALKQFVLGVRTDVEYSAIMQSAAPLQAPALQSAVVPTRLTDAQIKESIALAAFPTLYTFYLDWADRDLYSNDQYTPLAGKTFICTSTDTSYYWKSSVPALQPMGKDFTAEIQAVQDDVDDVAEDLQTLSAQHATDVAAIEDSIDPRLFFNGNKLTNNMENNLTLAQFLALTNTNDYGFIRIKGVVVTLITADGPKSYQWKGASWTTEDNWKEFGGSAAVGNCYNVTNEVPTSGYYDLEHAIAATYAKGLASVGMQITFAVGASTWKTYQYVGSDTTQNNFTDESNWVDMAGMSAGDEAIINVNDLCGAPSVGYYSLNSARNALVQFGTLTGIDYRKSGLVLTYMSGENVWESKQFNGVVEDFANDTLWHDFGGDDTVQVVTSDTPENEGEDAFSTGGAYTHLAKGMTPLTEEEVELIEDADTTNYNYYKLTNEAGDKIGEAFGLPKGGGGGSGEAKVTAIAFQASPLAAAAGSNDFIIRASIRSMKGSVSYGISTIKVIDNSTKQTLMTLSPDQSSSSTATDYSFVIDVSAFCKEAATRYLRITATDDDINETTGVGTSFSRIITVKAVDVTVRTLDNLAANMVNTTDTAKVLTLYQFPNNQGSNIEAMVDIFVGNDWVNLATTTIRDSSFHAVTVNATDIDGHGTALSHGSYLMRVQGRDTDANVSGNIIYTTLMVINASSSVPVVALRYNDASGVGHINQYETMTLDVAAYNNDSQTTAVTLNKNGSAVSSLTATRNRTYQVTLQVQESGTTANPTALAFQVVSGTAHSGTVTIYVVGSAIDAAIYAGALYAFDFASRSNQESNHAITSNGYEIAVNGANWNSNGFISYLGATALRIAENVTAEVNHAPFNDNALRANGLGIQFAFAARHIADDNAMLMRCYNPTNGAGFYVSGSKIGIFVNGGTPSLVERGYNPGEKVTVGIVIEPNTNTVTQLGVTYGLMKLYINGEEAGCIGFNVNNSNIQLTQNANITMNGTQGDFYLYWLMAWDRSQGIDWQQAFYNYLVKQTDTEAMVEEYDFENVFTSVIANGPDREALMERGMPYIIESPFLGSDVEALDNTMSTSDAIYITLRYFDPARPWRNWVAYGVQRRNQGTTSAKRPVKNARYYLAKKKGMPVSQSDKTLVGYDIVNGITRRGTTYTGVHMELLNPNYETTDAAILADMAATAALIAKNKVRVGESTIPVDIITVKVDYSDSTNANDCGACNMMNATYRMLASEYMTPAQRYFNGTYKVNDDLTLTGLQLNHSTANHPVATYRSLSEALNNPYFYAKGNWKEDKKEQTALGFMDTPGYNKGCLNYGDFVEYFGTSGETMQQLVTRFLADSSKNNSKVYLLSLYCGSTYKFYRYDEDNEQWADTTGTMRQVNGTWTITDDVLNPVDGFELLTYQGLCWWNNPSQLSNLNYFMEPISDKSSWVQKLLGADESITAPRWTRHFECMIDDDDLALAYAQGKKVPYWLYRLFDFLCSVDYSSVAASTWKANWRANAWKYLNPKSLMAYYLFTDYLAAVDQQAKNMQPMFFLDEGGEVVNGVYNNEQYVRMYPNKVYDADTLLGKDNDGGDTIDPEYDEMLAANFNDSNNYMGYGSVLWQDIVQQPEMVFNANNDTITLNEVARLMRTGSTTVDDRVLQPFSPAGAKYFFLNKIIKQWQKTVSSFDGEHKFISSQIDPDSGSTSPYFYALHGLRLTALPSFIDKRFAFRDAHYHTGSFTSGVIGGRIGAPDNATLQVTAAKVGFFAIGNDAGGSVSASADLAADESANFNVGTTNAGKLLYIYQAHRLKEIDLSNITLDSGWGFGACELLEVLKLGKSGKTNSSIASYLPMTNPIIGELPFLREVDIRETTIVTLDLGNCPRVEEVLAAGTSLTTLTLAQTAPIDTLTLPATMTSLIFINLPNLAYPASGGSGLTLGGVANIETLRIEGSTNINASTLLKAVLTAQNSSPKLTNLRIAGQTIKGDGTELALLITRNVQGLDDAGNSMVKPVIDGTYELTKLYESTDIAAWEAAIYGLTVQTVIDAYITLINEIQAGEDYGGDSEVPTITLANVDEYALTYYNGEEYDDYLSDYAAANADINDIVTS